MSRQKPITLTRKQKFALSKLTQGMKIPNNQVKDRVRAFSEGPKHYVEIKMPAGDWVKYFWVVEMDAWLPVGRGS